MKPYQKGLAIVFVGLAVVLWSCAVSRSTVADDAKPVILMFDVNGNTHIAADKILGVISNSRIGAPVDSNLVQQDLQAIYNLGYFADVRASMEKLFDGVKLIFTVVENPLLKEVRISGLSKINPRELQPFFTQKPGEVFSTAIFREDLGQALKYCQEKKGFYVRQTGNNSDPLTADGVYLLNLEELKYGETKIFGLVKTKEKVVRRELTFKEGDILYIPDFKSCLYRLYRTQLFENIEPQFESGATPDSLDLILSVKEAKTGNFAPGGSYNPQTGEVGLLLGYGESNLMGLGQKLNLDINFEASSRNATMSFYEPWLDDQHTSFGLSLWNTGANMNSTMQTWGYDSTLYDLHFVRTGLSVSLGRPVGKDITATVALSIEKNTIDQGAPKTDAPNGTPLEFWDNALQLSVVNDRLHYMDNNIVNGGFLLQGVLRSSGKYLGGYFDYQKTIFDGELFHALNADLVFGNRVELSYQNGTCPDYNRLYLGGQMRLRGYTNDMYSNQSLIGDYYWLNNAELRYRLPGNKNLEFVLLADAGQMFKNNVPTFKYDYGVGVRFIIPMLGMMRLDQAWNGDNGSQFVFGMNELF